MDLSEFVNFLFDPCLRCARSIFAVSPENSGLRMSLVIPTNFQHILRVLNTNIDGKRNIMFALTAIKGLGRR